MQFLVLQRRTDMHWKGFGVGWIIPQVAMGVLCTGFSILNVSGCVR